MNFKKMFGIVATVAMTLNLVPASVLGYTVSDDMQAAYDYAYEAGITTKDSAETANLMGTTSRAEMAKMISAYAQDVLGLTPDTSVTECEDFTDVSSSLGDLQDYITTACQLGLMGRNNDGSVATAFNPHGNITRAQYATLLGRALYNNAYDGESPYYAGYMDALEADGIITNTNPDIVELRRWTMKTLQVADEAGVATNAGCNDELTIAACAVGDSSCPAECQASEEVKAGSLSLSNIGVDYTSIPKAGFVNFGSLKFSSDGTEITVNSVKVKSTGLATLDSATRIFFEKDGVRISGKASFSNNEATVSFTTPLVVKSSETVDVTLLLSGAAGDEYQFTSINVDSSAQNVNGTWTSPSLRAANYSVLSVAYSATANALSPKVDSEKLVDIGQLNLTKSSSTQGVLVKAVTLYNSGTAELSYLADLGLYRDDQKVSTKATINGRSITFTLSDEITAVQTSAINYVVKAKITNADRVGDTYHFYLKNTEDMTVVEKNTSFRTTFSGTTPATMGLITVAGGDLKFVENTTASLTVVPGTQTVKFYDGTVTAIAPVTLEGFTVTATAGTGWDKVLSNLYIKIGNTVISVDTIPTTTGATFFFDGQTTVQGTEAVQIYGDLKSDAPAVTLNARSTFGLSSVTTKEYVSNGDVVTSSIGSIGGRTVTITAADLTLANSTATTKSVQRGDRNVEIAKLEFGTTSDVTSKLYSFKATVGGTTYGNFDGAQVTVYNEAGTALVSDTVRTGATTLTFVLPNYLTVSKATPVKLTVKLDQVPNAVNTGGMTLTTQFNTVNAKDVINNNAVGASLTANGSTLTSVVGGSVSVISQTYDKQFVKAGVTTTIGKVNLKAFNGDAVLKTMMLTGMDTSKLSSVKLMENGSAVISFSKVASGFYASNINQTIAVGTTKAYTVEATFSSAATSGDLAAAFTTYIDFATFESPYGSTLTSLSTTAISSTITEVNDVLTIASVDGIKGSNYASYKVGFTSAKQVKITKMTLALGQNLSTSISGATVTLSSAENAGGTIYATGTWNGVSTLALTPGTAIDVITSSTLYVTVSNVTWSAANGTPYVFIGLSDLDYSDVFDDLSLASHVNALLNYKNAMTTISDLGKNIQ
jgi:hypothetical protein